MQTIILSRHKTLDDSLLIDCLTEMNTKVTLKIPGILKSKKRNAYFYFPGALWNFTIIGKKDATMIPKEGELLMDPFGIKPEYESMQLLAQVIEPVKIMANFISQESNLFFYLKTVLSQWSSIEFLEKKLCALWLYLKILKTEGLLNDVMVCSNCGGTNAGRFLPRGKICAKCYASIVPEGISDQLAIYLLNTKDANDIKLNLKGKKITTETMDTFQAELLSLLKGEV